jgi:hypothetical protein
LEQYGCGKNGETEEVFGQKELAESLEVLESEFF